MNVKKQTVAVIIPAHNEERHISVCIESLLNQTVPVDEIIVVSNNSSDSTPDIVRKYPVVKLIETDVKGLINARNMGFNTAKSEILARLNADVKCNNDWNEKLLEGFRHSDIGGVSGVAKTMTLPFWPRLFTTFWSRIYIYYAEAYFGVHILWGANMAITKKAWDAIKDSACTLDSEVHEDQDLSIHLAAKSFEVKFLPRFIVSTNEKSYFSWRKFHLYNQIRKYTKLSHKEELNSANKYGLGAFERACRYLVIFIPGSIFYITSFLSGLILR